MSVNVRPHSTEHVAGTGVMACLLLEDGTEYRGGSLEQPGAPQEKSVRGCNWKSYVIFSCKFSSKAFIHEMVDYHRASVITGL